MGLVIDVVKLLFQHMGVNVGRGNIRMAQHFLNGTQIRTVLQQVNSKGMAQRMGRDFLFPSSS